MPSKLQRREPQTIRGERVGRFHFAPGGPRQFRLVAILHGGAHIVLRTAKTIGDLWRSPWLVTPEIESEVVTLRVEARPDTAVPSPWQAVLRENPSRRSSDE